MTRQQRARRIWIMVGALALVLGAVAVTVVVASGPGDSRARSGAAPPTGAPPTTASPAIAPLTGLPDPSGQSQVRPALSVKVENTPDARPQVGIDAADVVYEEEVEGNITRFVAIFNSTAPETIGPVRSVRMQDADIVWPIHGIFAYSGGAQEPVDAINAAPVHAVDNTAAVASGVNAMERDAPGQPPRDAPHNLYGHGPALFSLGGEPAPPPPLFQYAAPGLPLAEGSDPGEPVVGAHVGFQGGYDVSYAWDPASATWMRFVHGEPHVVVGGEQIAPTNVVVQFTVYDGESSAQTVGEGDAWVFSDGRVRRGRWLRPAREQPARYVDANGEPIFLRPGRTWVELLPSEYAVGVEPAPATAPPNGAATPSVRP